MGKLFINKEVMKIIKFLMIIMLFVALILTVDSRKLKKKHIKTHHKLNSKAVFCENCFDEAKKTCTKGTNCDTCCKLNESKCEKIINFNSVAACNGENTKLF